MKFKLKMKDSGLLENNHGRIQINYYGKDGKV